MPETPARGHDVTLSGRAVRAGAAASGTAPAAAAASGAESAGYELASARWPEIAARPRRLLVVPLGSVEQHGPHLPLDTDTRTASAVARRACAVVAANAGGRVSADGTGDTGTAGHGDPGGDAGAAGTAGPGDGG